MFKSIINVAASRSGATAVEYALIASWLTIAIVTAIMRYGH